MPSVSIMTGGQVLRGLPGELNAQLRGPRLHQLDHVADGLVQVGGSSAGSRSFENESMSMTRL